MIDDSQKTRKPGRKPGTKRKQSARPGKRYAEGPDKRSETSHWRVPLLSEVLDVLKQEAAGSALRVAARAGGTSLKIGTALLPKPEQRMIVREAGGLLAALRHRAGMTRNEVDNALKAPDTSLLKAAEEWTATFSIELIMRIAGLYSRDDLIPFIITYTRTYSPAIWKLLEDRGTGR